MKKGVISKSKEKELYPEENPNSLIMKLEQKSNQLVGLLKELPFQIKQFILKIYESDKIEYEEILANLKIIKSKSGMERIKAETFVVNAENYELNIKEKITKIENIMDKESEIFKEAEIWRNNSKTILNLCTKTDLDKLFANISKANDEIEIGIISNLAKIIEGDNEINKKQIRTIVTNYDLLKEKMNSFFSKANPLKKEFIYLLLNTTNIFLLDIELSGSKYSHLIHYAKWIINSAEFLLCQCLINDKRQANNLLQKKIDKKAKFLNDIANNKKLIQDLYSTASDGISDFNLNLQKTNKCLKSFIQTIEKSKTQIILLFDEDIKKLNQLLQEQSKISQFPSQSPSSGKIPFIKGPSAENQLENNIQIIVENDNLIITYQKKIPMKYIQYYKELNK